MDFQLKPCDCKSAYENSGDVVLKSSSNNALNARMPMQDDFDDWGIKCIDVMLLRDREIIVHQLVHDQLLATHYCG